MGIFSRLGDILNANISALLDRAEDPEKMIRLVIQEMEDTLIEVRSSAVKALADRKDLERRVAEHRRAQDDWSQKAEFALSRDREDLARGALMARQKLGEDIALLETELTGINEAIAKFDEDLSNLQKRLEEAKTRQKALEIRMNTATRRVQVRQTLYDGRIDAALGRYDSIERRIAELEGKADAYDLGRGKDLAGEFAELESSTAVEDELAALKRKLGR
ncbi:phage shock protein PspA [Novispirillum itersonii]|uniref:Phage shock protein A n=1 Tax=Novispirillum itersonii TaxID=189 RepID=A0A7W9ZHW6_NOVIT|nr:phage shock protein PspA [Novispirillum itersonii]MBB6211792.1 phage shock protein A [Novispirillum itersonii]